MVWLQSNEKFDDIAELDVESGEWKICRREENVHVQTDGFFSILSQVFCAIFRSGNQLHFRIGDKQFELTEGVEIAVNGALEKRFLSVRRRGSPEIEFEYSLSSFAIDGDITPFLEDEDLDFGLFLSNIATDPNRQAVLKGEA